MCSYYYFICLSLCYLVHLLTEIVNDPRSDGQIAVKWELFCVIFGVCKHTIHIVLTPLIILWRSPLVLHAYVQPEK